MPHQSTPMVANTPIPTGYPPENLRVNLPYSDYVNWKERKTLVNWLRRQEYKAEGHLFVVMHRELADDAPDKENTIYLFVDHPQPNIAGCPVMLAEVPARIPSRFVEAFEAYTTEVFCGRAHEADTTLTKQVNQLLDLVSYRLEDALIATIDDSRDDYPLRAETIREWLAVLAWSVSNAEYQHRVTIEPA